jgi:hypothetical protein
VRCSGGVMDGWVRLDCAYSAGIFLDYLWGRIGIA